jgi:hypothetical protein
MSIIEHTKQSFNAYLDRQYGDSAPVTRRTINRWLERGDGAAIFENHDLGSPDVGSPQIASYGSSLAMLEGLVPPKMMPDIGTSVNWRYVLVATYRGGKL